MDPYTQVYNAIWAALEASNEFTGLVRPGNRIKLCGQAPVVKDSVQPGDLPEVEIAPADDTGFAYGDSANSMTDTCLFRISVFTGTFRLDEEGRGMFPVKWAIIRALRARPTLALSFVESARAINMGTSPKNPRGLGWSFSMTLRVVLRFPRTGDTITV